MRASVVGGGGGGDGSGGAGVTTCHRVDERGVRRTGDQEARHERIAGAGGVADIVQCRSRNLDRLAVGLQDERRGGLLA